MSTLMLALGPELLGLSSSDARAVIVLSTSLNPLSSCVLPLQFIYAHFYVVSYGVPGRPFLVPDHDRATGAVELNDPAYLRVRREATVLEDRVIKGPGVAFVDEAALLVVLPGRYQLPAAPIAAPHLFFQVDVQVLSHPHLLAHASFLLDPPVKVLVDHIAAARRDENGGVDAFDDCQAADHISTRQRTLLVDLGVMELAIPVDGSFALERLVRALFGRCASGKRGAGDGRECLAPQLLDGNLVIGCVQHRLSSIEIEESAYTLFSAQEDWRPSCHCRTRGALRGHEQRP